MKPPYFESDGVTLHLGDCLDVLRAMPDASVDAVVTDPPAGISFMGRAWDGDLGGRLQWVAWHAERLAEAARVLKPGGHALVWALPRTSHWTACAIEDAGLEIRDCVTHLFGSGFPKSLNVGDGRGTALKPAAEHWWLARKPLAGTVAANVLQFGTGALNIDGCRVEWDGASLAKDTARRQQPRHDMTGGRLLGGASGEYQGDAASPSGRWPTNVVFSHPPLIVDGEIVGDACADGCVPGCPVAELDQQSGVTKSSGGARGGHIGVNGVFGQFEHNGPRAHAGGLGDVGGASRFFPAFRYEAKAPASERPRLADGTAHTTVKPLALMRWLVRLVTPPGGLVLDPFAGSGTTGEACVIEGFRAVLIEREEPHAELIKVRLAKPIAPTLFGGLS